MTVGSNVKSCYFSIKSAEASLNELALKTTNEEKKQAFSQAKKQLQAIKHDLHQQILYLTNEEPQY